MAGELVLITGSTGHVGYAVLIEALSKGYNVRAAVRSEAKIAELKAAKSSHQYLDQLSFVIVPDITTDGAFDEAVKGVDYIIHVASPLSKPTTDFEGEVIKPAVQGTLSILYSALKEPSIKRVVITSSIAAVLPNPVTGVFTAEDTQPDPQGPYPDGFVAYLASKKLAYNRTRDFLAKEKPKYTVVNIMPSFIIGKNELATTPEAALSGSNGFLLGLLLGKKNPSPLISTVVHLQDVAFAHVASLDPKIEGNQAFGLNYNGVKGIVWEDAFDIVRKHFPAAVESGILPLTGSLPSANVPFDAHKTELALNFKYRDYEEMVVSTAGHYISLVSAASSKA